MSQFNTPVRRTSGEIDVYTGLLCAAFLVLLVGVIMLAVRNSEHSTVGSTPGGMLRLVDQK